MTGDPASFRDPDARVLGRDGGRILRALSARAAAVDAHLRANGLFAALVRDGLLVETAPRPDVPAPPGWSTVVDARALPFVSYPYEWSFSMLRDAALLTLELTARALEHGAMLKDASAYNVLFEGARPVFVDLGSFEAYAEGAPWTAYGQFCDHFLAPLMLEAYRGVPFQSLLRSNLEGIPVVTHLAPLLRGRDLLRPGVLAHVKLRALLDRRTRRLDTESRRRLRRMAIPKAALLRNVAGLRRLVSGLRSRSPSDWVAYGGGGYDAAAAERKAAFVDAAARREAGALAWDVGANDGRYSRLLAPHYRTVVAMDADAGAVDALYRRLRGTPEAETILPLVCDLLNPSPAQGWRGRERDTPEARGRPDLALYLALLHHVCVGRGVPLPDFLDLARETSSRAVVEFVALEDPMSQTILATKVRTHAGYDLSSFRTLARERGEIVREESLSATRTLFLLAFRP